jgi:hypothetical protein
VKDGANIVSMNKEHPTFPGLVSGGLKSLS